MASNDEGPELVAGQPTAGLQAIRDALRRPAAADPDFLNALAVAVGALLDRELSHSARKKRDEDEAKAKAKAAEDEAKQAAAAAAKASSAPEVAAGAAEKKGSTSQRASA